MSDSRSKQGEKEYEKVTLDSEKVADDGDNANSDSDTSYSENSMDEIEADEFEDKKPSSSASTSLPSSSRSSAVSAPAPINNADYVKQSLKHMRNCDEIFIAHMKECLNEVKKEFKKIQFYLHKNINITLMLFFKKLQMIKMNYGRSTYLL